MVFHKQRWWRLQARNLQNYLYNLYLRLFKPFNFIHSPGGPKRGGLNIFFSSMLISYLTYEILYIPVYCSRWFACNGYEGEAYSLIWPIRGCASGQSIVRVQNLDTLDTNEPLIKRHLISTNRNIHPYIIQIRTPGKFKLSFLDLITGRHNTVLV